MVGKRKEHPSVAYIDCPRRCWARSPRAVKNAIQNARDVGANVINLTFDSQADAPLLEAGDREAANEVQVY